MQRHQRHPDSPIGQLTSDRRGLCPPRLRKVALRGAVVEAVARWIANAGLGLRMTNDQHDGAIS